LLTLKKLFPWLARSVSDFGLFLLYKAYKLNWSCYMFTREKKHKRAIF